MADWHRPILCLYFIFPPQPAAAMIAELLEQSAATDAFRAAVDDFLRSGRGNDRIEIASRAPDVKIARTLTKILEAFPELDIERVTIDGQSGCEFFRGTASIEAAGGGRQVVRFDWDCRWRAEKQGWKDYFGFPDQARAAREFGYDCFRVWEADSPVGAP